MFWQIMSLFNVILILETIANIKSEFEKWNFKSFFLFLIKYLGGVGVFISFCVYLQLDYNKKLIYSFCTYCFKV